MLHGEAGLSRDHADLTECLPRFRPRSLACRAAIWYDTQESARAFVRFCNAPAGSLPGRTLAAAFARGPPNGAHFFIKKVEVDFSPMDDGSLTTMIAALVALVCMSAFFSACETAYSSLNLIRLKSRAEAGDATAKRVLALAEQYDNLLSTILIGNNIVNIGASSLATVLFIELVGAERGPTVSTIAMTVIVLVFGEVTPKSLAKEMPERFATLVAPVLQALVTLFTPFNWLFAVWKKFLSRHFHTGEADTVTEGELITLVSEAEEDGEITDRESELIRSAIEFDDVEVQEVLTPRVDVVAIADDATVEELAEKFAESGYSRLPVYHQTIDNIIGVVHEKDFYAKSRKGAVKVEELLTPTLYTTGTTQISALLRTLREQHHHLAVVVDEYGGTEGIITLEDIIEELVGEIWDEHDEAVEDVRPQADGTWLVSGGANLDDVCDELGVRIDAEIDALDAITISGLVQEQNGRLPKVGEKFTLGGYEGTVTKTAHRRVLEVRLVKAEQPQPEPEKPSLRK